jgi:hypothetical protein
MFTAKHHKINNAANDDRIVKTLENRVRFLFYDNKSGKKNIKIPAFFISFVDEKTAKMLKNMLNLKNNIYEYPLKIGNDGYKRSPLFVIIVRDVGQLKNLIVPFFSRAISGNMLKNLDLWIHNIGADPLVPDRYKIISKLYSRGFYGKK